MLHLPRQPLASRHPVYISLRAARALPSPGQPPLVRPTEECLRAGKERDGFRVVHYAIQQHHLRLIVEAKSAPALTRGMQALSIRIARGINRTLGRQGRVFIDRYSADILRSLEQVQHALRSMAAGKEPPITGTLTPPRTALLKACAHLWPPPAGAGE